MSRRIALALGLLALTLVFPLSSAFAGTQDFSLVNQTGTEIYRLYISETSNDSWEEDVLGDGVLPDGNRLDVDFYGRSACYWDMLAEDEQGNTLTFSGLNLCEASTVVLKCSSTECWAEWE